MAEFGRVDSLDLAGYVLSKIEQVKHLKLQKLVYYIEAWHLAAFDRPLIADEFEAWLHGPVSRRIWDRYKSESTIYDPLPVDREEVGRASERVIAALNDDQLELINDVLSEYGTKSAYYLECLTHSEEPWRAARVGVGDGEASTNKISKNLMKHFYRARLATA